MTTAADDASPDPGAWRAETRAIRAGRPSGSRSLAPALWASTVWTSLDATDARRRAQALRAPEFYGRHANPTVTSFEEAVAELEGAEASLAFASGMGAISATVLALCRSGSHVVASVRCTRRRSCSWRRSALAWASRSRSSTPPSRAPSRPRCGRGTRCSSWPRPRPTRASSSRTSPSSDRSPGPSPSWTRPSPPRSGSARWSTACRCPCIRPPRASQGTTTPRSA